MDKWLEFGRKAIFYVRVLSGYEERRIRNYRLKLEKRLQQAEARKVALRKLPEQAILGEVRRMVGEMQALNKKLEETEAAIEQYLKPIDKEAEMIMKTQIDSEEKTMKQMMETIQREADKAEAQKVSETQHKQDAEEPDNNSRHAQMR
ncbi:hypothetical protein ACFE04_027501 [Oxalis oulophora]